MKHQWDIQTVVEMRQEVRRAAQTVSQVWGMLNADAEHYRDVVEIVVTEDLRECVRSAASIVSSASSAATSQPDLYSIDVTANSDFGDCFPVRQNETVRR